MTGMSNLVSSAIQDAFIAGMAKRPSVFQQIFQVKTSAKERETELAVAGLGEWSQTDDLEAGGTDDMVEIGTAAYIHDTFQMHVPIPRKLIDDDNLGLIMDEIGKMGAGAILAADRKAAAVLNNAFTSGTGPDAAYLCATHSLAKSASTISNAGSGALTETTFDSAMTAIQTQKDDNYKELSIMPTIMVVPPAQFKKASIIVGSQQLSGTGNNDINPYANMVKIIVNPFLSSATAWFLIDQIMAKLKFFWRVAPEVTIEKKSNAYIAHGYARLSVGFSDWRGVYGSTGA